mgnify:CR=1 FL=1
MYGKLKTHLCNTLAEIKEAGLYKSERLIESPQQAVIDVNGKEVLVPQFTLTDVRADFTRNWV